MEAVLPGWLDQVRGVDFAQEKQMLSDLERWAIQDNWEVTDGTVLPSDLARRTDVLLRDAKRNRWFRVSVLPKAKGSPGSIRLDASTHRIFELVNLPRKKGWRLETGTVPLKDGFARKDDWDLLVDLAFRE
jgi:hypothetical protein